MKTKVPQPKPQPNQTISMQLKYEFPLRVLNFSVISGPVWKFESHFTRIILDMKLQHVLSFYIHKTNNQNVNAEQHRQPKKLKFKVNPLFLFLLINLIGKSS